MRCLNCGIGETHTIPVWSDMEDYEAGDGPDYVGCTACNTMLPTDND